MSAGNFSPEIWLKCPNLDDDDLNTEGKGVSRDGLHTVVMTGFSDLYHNTITLTPYCTEALVE
jgi:hypothetical protein